MQVALRSKLTHCRNNHYSNVQPVRLLMCRLPRQDSRRHRQQQAGRCIHQAQLASPGDAPHNECMDC